MKNIMKFVMTALIRICLGAVVTLMGGGLLVGVIFLAHLVYLAIGSLFFTIICLALICTYSWGFGDMLITELKERRKK